MKKILILLLLLVIKITVFAQEPKGTSKVNNIKVYGQIKPEPQVINTSPDYVITQDTTNKKTTYTEVSEVSTISMTSFVDTLEQQPFDSLIVFKFKLADSSAIAISSDGDTLATMPSMRAYVAGLCGVLTGLTNTYQTFLGIGAGSLTTGYYNVFLGKNAGNVNTTGYQNTFIGAESGMSSVGSFANVFVGHNSGHSNVSGTYNTFLGHNAGYNNTGSNNVFIGRSAGENEAGSNKLYIDNSNTSSPLIGGDFSLDQLNFNGGLIYNTTVVNSATYDLQTGDYILLVTYTTTGAVTSLTLPTAQMVDGRKIIIKDAGFNAGTNNITIDTEGSETIDGSATLVINANESSYVLTTDGSNWYIVSVY